MANKLKCAKVYLTDDMYSYVDSCSEDLGMSKSAFCVMCINQYRQQQEALSRMSELERMVNDLKVLQAKGGFKK